MPRWHFRNRSHPGKGMCRMGAVSGVHGHKSGFDLSLSFSRWASDSACSLCSQMTAPRWQMEPHPGHCTGPLLLPELPHAMGPPAAGCLTQLDCCWRCVGGPACCCLPALFFWVMPQPAPVLLCWCLRAVLSFQLSQYTVQMLCKTASVAEHAELSRNS